MRSGKPRLAAGAVALLLAADALAGAEPSAEEAAFLERVNRPVVYAVPGMERVAVKKDLVYATDGDARLAMDVYSPPPGAGGPARRPAVLFIHGGVGPEFPVRPKDWGIYRSWGRLAAASGLAGVTFNHRVGFPDPALGKGAGDLRDAIAFVRGHAEDLGIDPDRLALAAYSAGGPLLADAIREPKPWVRCLVAFYAFLDVSQSALHRKYLPPELLRRFSPAAALGESRGTIPPIFVARAGRDEIPDLEPGLDRFVAEAVARNVPLVFYNQPGGAHGFDNDPGDPRSVEIVRAAVEFLKRNLGP